MPPPPPETSLWDFALCIHPERSWLHGPSPGLLTSMPFPVPFLTPGNPSPSPPCTGFDFTIHLLFLHSFIHNKCFTTCLLCIQLWARYFHRSYQSSCQPFKGKSVICILWRKQLGLREVKSLASDNLAGKRQSWDLAPTCQPLEPSLLLSVLCVLRHGVRKQGRQRKAGLCAWVRRVNWERRGGGEVGADQISTGVRGSGSFYKEDLERR